VATKYGLVEEDQDEVEEKEDEVEEKEEEEEEEEEMPLITISGNEFVEPEPDKDDQDDEDDLDDLELLLGEFGQSACLGYELEEEEEEDDTGRISKRRKV
jgi:hypothetical protein